MVEQGTNNRAKVIVSPRKQTSNEPGRERIVRFNPIGRLDFQPRQRDESLLLSSRARELIDRATYADMCRDTYRNSCTHTVLAQRLDYRLTLNQPPGTSGPIFPPPSPRDFERFLSFPVYDTHSTVATSPRWTNEQRAREDFFASRIEKFIEWFEIGKILNWVFHRHFVGF